MTQLYLAWSGATQAQFTLSKIPWEDWRLGILVSFHYGKQFRAFEEKYGELTPARWMLDSGAFSAWNAGSTIDIDALIQESKNPRWHETVALDVIGDSQGSEKNAAYMKSKGSPAFPVFHYGEDWGVLERYRRDHWKVGLSCLFGEPRNKSLSWYRQCFARAWPHRFHSFGWVDMNVLRELPFHSADASSWATGPLSFGRWKNSYGRLYGLTSSDLKDLRCEVEPMARWQKELTARWAKEMSRWSETTTTPSSIWGSKTTPQQKSST